MSCAHSPSRRLFLQRLSFVSLAPLAAGAARVTHAGDAALLAANSPEAKAVQYTEDAKKAKGATPGATCATCALYQGTYGSDQGACQIFPGKQVKAAGWCSSWAPQL
jgi:hypothetical protein